METVEQFLGKYQVAIALQKAKDQTKKIEELEVKLARSIRSAQALSEALQVYSSQK